LLGIPGSELYFWSKKVGLSGLRGEALGKKAGVLSSDVRK